MQFLQENVKGAKFTKCKSCCFHHVTLFINAHSVLFTTVPDELLSQPQPVNGNIGISTVTSIQNNAKRPTALSPQQQQPVSRYPPREVPPRFRHQDQKSLLKRGQQIPGIAASLGSATKVLNQESESSTVSCQERTVTETPPGKHCMHGLFSQH